MIKQLWPYYIGCIVLFSILYFGTDVVSDNQKNLEKSRSLVKQSKSTEIIKRDAFHSLTPEQQAQVDEINVLIEREKDENSRILLTERLAGMWYQLGFPEVSGLYAEEIASKKETADAWAITGTTYMRCLEMSQDDKTKEFCAQKARAALDQAKLLNPENVEVDLNQALSYVLMPDQTNPMKGIQLLLQIKNNNPEYGPAYRHLGRLAIQTGQFQRAVERLKVAEQLEEDNKRVSCLLAEAYSGLGVTDSASIYKEICNN